LEQANAARLDVQLAESSDVQIEQSLRRTFLVALTEAASAEPEQIAACADWLLGVGCTVVLEAQKHAWSRYRVVVRVQGLPVTIATIELTLPD
jgi:hypothetical protein